MAKKPRLSPAPPAKRRRGRPPKPGGPTPQVEIQRAYRARLAAAGKIVRLVYASHVTPAPGSPVLTSICQRQSDFALGTAASLGV